MYCSCCLRTQETVQPSPHKLCLQQSASHQRQQPPKVHVSARGGEKLRLDRDVQRQLVLYFFTWTESVAREFQKGGNHREKFVCETSLKMWVKFLIFGNRLKKKKIYIQQLNSWCQTLISTHTFPAADWVGCIWPFLFLSKGNKHDFNTHFM